MPAFRQMSATGTPSAPCLRMNAFWASENCDAFIVFRSSQPGENTAENSNSERSSFQGADQACCCLTEDLFQASLDWIARQAWPPNPYRSSSPDTWWIFQDVRKPAFRPR